MVSRGIQFKVGLWLPDFQGLCGSEGQCEDALEKARWPDGFRFPYCISQEHGLDYDRRLKRYSVPQLRPSGHAHDLHNDAG